MGSRDKVSARQCSYSSRAEKRPGTFEDQKRGPCDKREHKRGERVGVRSTQVWTIVRSWVSTSEASGDQGWLLKSQKGLVWLCFERSLGRGQLGEEEGDGS